jgi:hypothetical protein
LILLTTCSAALLDLERSSLRAAECMSLAAAVAAPNSYNDLTQ